MTIIKRIIPEDNERQKKIYVLEKGASLAEQFNKIFSEVEGNITSGLTDVEADMFMKLLLKVNKVL
ncbi:hypothetical protein D3C86_441860 [compost metagenome]